jgi:uncharacterized protein (TIGR02117 family)
MARRRGKGARRKWLRRTAIAILAIPSIYLFAALVGALVPVNRGWIEPAQGTTVYLIDNGTHADLLMPINAQGLDWAPLFPQRDFAAPDPGASFIAFGAGEENVYLNTPTWWDITPRTLFAALAGGRRVMHVEIEPSPAYAAHEIRLRPEEYRRLWAAVRADFVLDANGRPQRIAHAGYGPADAFYLARGRQSAISTCNNRVAAWLRLAGVKTSAWPPFVKTLVWRYRRYSPVRLLQST